MMIYETLLAVGAIGLIAQAVLGFAHSGGGHGGHAGHEGHVGSVAHHAEGGGHHHINGHHHADHGPATSLWTLVSPLRWFATSLGAGATGLLLRGVLHPPLLVAFLAALGGVLFHGLVVQPLFRLALRFASQPAATLAGAVATEAIADSRFDPAGAGIVRATVDGQVVRLLAQLDEPTDVAPGERLVVTSVDPQKNTCRVTRL